MSDRIAKQLIFSPDPPAADTAFNVPVQPYNVVNRLDGQLMTAWEASSAFAGVPQNITSKQLLVCCSKHGDKDANALKSYCTALTCATVHSHCRLVHMALIQPLGQGAQDNCILADCFLCSLNRSERQPNIQSTI
jgi:hypothetical protein